MQLLTIGKWIYSKHGDSSVNCWRLNQVNCTKARLSYWYVQLLALECAYLHVQFNRILIYMLGIRESTDSMIHIVLRAVPRVVKLIHL